MSGTLHLSGALQVGSLAAAPSNPEVGFQYYDTVLGKYRQWDGAAWVEPANIEALSSNANGEGASTVGIEDSAAQFTSTNVEGALTESLDAAQAAQVDATAAQGDIDAHKDGGANKHDASEIDVEAADGKNHTAGSAESVIGQLDDAIGALAATPVNYSPTSAAIVADHLSAIDGALASAGGNEYVDDVFRVIGSVDATKKIALEADGITTATTRTITMPDSDVNLGDIATNSAKVSADGSVATHSDVTDAGSGIIISAAERTKLTNIEALADVTDATNVAASGAVMESDTTTALMNFVIDEDNMISDLATKVPTQQSVKAYVDTKVTSAVSYKGGYDAATDTPSLDSAPNVGIAIGDQYTVTVAGVFYTINVEIGDVLIAESVDPIAEADWTVVQANLDAASIKVQYESNADTNAFTDAEQTKVSNLSGTNSGDEVAASDIVSGIVELATLAEVDAGSDAVRAVTPASLATIQTDVNANTAKVGYTAAQAKIDLIDDAITDAVTDKAPSQNAVFDALALKLANVSEDAAPSLGGDLTLGANVVIHNADGMKRGSSNSAFLEEEYIDSTALAASQTGTVISALTFAHASYSALEIVYIVKEATSNDMKQGTLRVVSNGTAVSINDLAVQTADTGIVFSAAINGANVEVKYDSGANAATLRMDVKRIKAL